MLVATLAGGAAWARRLVAHDALFTVWSDRDLARALAVTEAFPVAGAELTGPSGARIPGGLQSLILAPPVLLGFDALGAMRWQVLLEGVGLTALALGIARLVGPAWGLLAAALVAVHPVTAVTSGQVWNPGLLPLALGLVVAGLLGSWGRGDGRALALVVAGALVGLQAHLSILPVLAAATVLLAWRRPPVTRGTAAVCVGLVVLAYAPFLVHEALDGFRDLRALGRQPDLQPGTHATPAHAQALALLELVGAARAAELPFDAATRAAGGLMLLVPLAWALARGRDRAADAVALAGLALLATSLLALTLDGAVNLRAHHAERFAEASVFALATAVAGTGAALAARWPRAGRLTAAWVVALGTVVLASEPWRRDLEDPEAWRTLPRVQARLDGLQALVGGELDDVVARTIVLRAPGPTWAGRAEDGQAFLLARRGLPWPGAGAPPCAGAFVSRFPDDAPPITQERLEEALRQPLPGFRILEQVDLPGERLVRYELDLPACPSTMVQKHVPTPTEARLARLAPDSGPTRWVDDADHLLVAFHRDWLPLALEVEADDGGLRWRLHGQPLRGRAWNLGVLATASLAAPHVDVELPEGGALRVDFPPFVGEPGVPTPVSARSEALPPGSRLVLRYALVDQRTTPGAGAGARVDALPSTPSEVDLGTWPPAR
ncbi:MAG: hypothetical protein H6732_09590 [Alphaproteobacteria bacterium]|nr:hypothetical protein [Alphaproteobacteria bacterium]